VDAAALRAQIEEHIRRHELIPPSGNVVCLVSGGADSTCLWHALGALGYRAGALHVNHRRRGEESEEDAELSRLLLRSLIQRSAAKTMIERDVLSRTIVGALLEQAAAPLGLTAKLVGDTVEITMTEAVGIAVSKP